MARRCIRHIQTDCRYRLSSTIGSGSNNCIINLNCIKEIYRPMPTPIPSLTQSHGDLLAYADSSTFIYGDLTAYAVSNSHIHILFILIRRLIGPRRLL